MLIGDEDDEVGTRHRPSSHRNDSTPRPPRLTESRRLIYARTRLVTLRILSARPWRPSKPGFREDCPNASKPLVSLNPGDAARRAHGVCSGGATAICIQVGR